jgi:hypothetical protein
MKEFVTHNQLIIILLLILIGVGIFSYAMLKHAVELRQITTKVIEDLSIVQGFIDVELATTLVEQQLAIDAILVDQAIQDDNLEKLKQNSNLTYTNFLTIKNSADFGAAQTNTNIIDYNIFL